ncbi:MAG TPA: hypothetical protein V6D14_09665 [Coleofasciculaceae cyanobacterium]|jgi:hypothetical protein
MPGTLIIKKNTVFKQVTRDESVRPIPDTDKTPIIPAGQAFQFDSIEFKNDRDGNSFEKHKHLAVRFSSPGVKPITGNAILNWWVYADHVKEIKG